MDRIPSFLVTAVTLVMGVATAVLSITVPSLWSMAGDIGAVKARVEAFDRRFDAIDKRLESIDGKVELVGKRADGIDARPAQRETDPSALVAQSGLRPESEFGGLRIGQKLFVLPKSDKATVDLASSGLQREAITPSTFGYVIGTFDAAGRLQTSGSAATGRARCCLFSGERRSFGSVSAVAPATALSRASGTPCPRAAASWPRECAS